MADYNFRVLIGILLIVLVAFGLYELILPKKYDPKSVIKKIEKLDDKYGTDWKKEMLPEVLVKKEIIPNLINDLEKILEKTPNNETISKKILEARIQNLEAQNNIYNAIELGDKGKVKFQLRANTGIPVPTEVINCAEKDELRQGLEYFNNTWQKTLNATLLMDDVLNAQPELRDIIGIKKNGIDNRPAFYKTRLNILSLQVKINKFAVDNCA